MRFPGRLVTWLIAAASALGAVACAATPSPVVPPRADPRCEGLLDPTLRCETVPEHAQRGVDPASAPDFRKPRSEAKAMAEPVHIHESPPASPRPPVAPPPRPPRPR